MRPLFALTANDLGHIVADPEGWVTVWTRADIPLALPSLVNRLTGRPYLGTRAGPDPALIVPDHVVAQILRASDAQTLADEAAKARRAYWHALIRGQKREPTFYCDDVRPMERIPWPDPRPK